MQSHLSGNPPAPATAFETLTWCCIFVRQNGIGVGACGAHTTGTL